MTNRRPKKPCAKLGCCALVSPPDRYCAMHKPVELVDIQIRNKNYDDSRRDSVHWKFYKSKEWIKARAEAMRRDNGICQDCYARGDVVFATMVHHTIPLKKRWDLRLISTNLVCLCDSCHNKRDHK